MVDAATLGSWRSQENRDSWSLHGEAREFKGKLKDGVGPSMQILKAAKHSTPYAEYWPSASDGELIVRAANMFPFFLDWAQDVLTRHFPTICGCKNIHYLCAPHRNYNWDECPEIKAVDQALQGLHAFGQTHVVLD